MGALLYVFSKGAKFSLFKPAEEMVYITMDEEGRTKGKAAIDVVGAQARLALQQGALGGIGTAEAAMSCWRGGGGLGGWHQGVARLAGTRKERGSKLVPEPLARER